MLSICLKFSNLAAGGLYIDVTYLLLDFLLLFNWTVKDSQSGEFTQRFLTTLKVSEFWSKIDTPPPLQLFAHAIKVFWKI